MDVYGYQSYQYSQADELTNQILAQQALATSVPYNRSISEPHNMPAPSGAPWNVQTVPWGMSSPPPVVQFSAPVEPKAPPVIHSKRKSLDIEPVIPAKQLITEEKMVAHLSGLHISSQYTPHSLAADDLMDIGSTDATPPPITEKLQGHKLVLSEELKKLKDEPLLPAALIERWANYIRSRPQLEKPRMSLVVWKPKEDILEKIIEEKEKKKEEGKENEEPVKRNGVLVTELPTMDVEM